jgi:small subunit ribosomal protein S4e
MGKRGAKKHKKRIAVSTAVPVHDKKGHVWISKTIAGPHPSERSIPLGVLLRDVLKLVRTAKEAKKILSGRQVLIDGKVRVEERFPVGLMDVVSLPKSGHNFRLVVDRKGRLIPLEIKNEESSSKIAKVVRKNTVKGGKTTLTMHDGKNLLSDNHIMVGDSIILSLPEAKLSKHLKRDADCRCLVMEGKHAGTMVKLKEIIERTGGKPNEAVVTTDSGEFITVAKYLFVVDEGFRVSQ